MDDPCIGCRFRDKRQCMLFECIGLLPRILGRQRQGPGCRKKLDLQRLRVLAVRDSLGRKENLSDSRSERIWGDESA